VCVFISSRGEAKTTTCSNFQNGQGLLWALPVLLVAMDSVENIIDATITSDAGAG
jgi:hypothetical protein